MGDDNLGRIVGTAVRRIGLFKTGARCPAMPSGSAHGLRDELDAPRKGEPLNIVVAHTEVVGGHVHLEVRAPARARAAPGAKLLVKHVYRLQESSKDREEYRILLKSVLNGKTHPPSIKRFGDNYALTDDYSGFVMHEYTLPQQGEALLEFDVAAEYTVGEWKSEQVDVNERRDGSGLVRIKIS